MSSASRTDRPDPAGAVPPSDEEIGEARREVEQAIRRLRAMGVEIAGVTDQPDDATSATSDASDASGASASDASAGSTAARDLRQRERQAELDHANDIAAELEAARRRSGRLFGRQAAKRVLSLELAERLARERVTPAPPPVVPPTGPGLVDLEDLEHALADLKAADDRLADLLQPAGPTAHRRSRPWRPVTLP